jgi:hypothetical protein
MYPYSVIEKIERPGPVEPAFYALRYKERQHIANAGCNEIPPVAEAGYSQQSKQYRHYYFALAHPGDTVHHFVNGIGMVGIEQCKKFLLAHGEIHDAAYYDPHSERDEEPRI